MKIITVPHPTLRVVAQPVTTVDKKLKTFIADLQKTLGEKRNPKGVGLAATQVDVKWRIFSTQLPADPESKTAKTTVLRAFINPVIIGHSAKMTLGSNKKEPTLEGCLSIPGFYGPVPRWENITLSYQVITGDTLTEKEEVFTEFAARVVQHETDHLNGVLFIDYAQRYGLPLYQENKHDDKLYELDDDMIAALVTQSQV